MASNHYAENAQVVRELRNEIDRLRLTIESQKNTYEARLDNLKEQMAVEKAAVADVFQKKRNVMAAESAERAERFEKEKAQMAKIFDEERVVMAKRFEAEMMAMAERSKREKVEVEKMFDREAVAMAERFEKDKVVMAKRFEGEMVAMAKGFDKERAEMREMTDKSNAKREAMAERFDKEKADMREMFNKNDAAMAAERAAMAKNFDEEKAAMLYRQSQEIHRTRGGHEAEKKDMKKWHDTEKVALETKREKETKSLRDDIDTLKRALQYDHDQEMHRTMEIHEAEKREIKKQHDTEKAALEIKREKEIKSLRDDIETLKRAVVKRDHFKVMSGHELTHRFQDLASDIDDLARVQWDNGREPTWPFPDKLLRNSENMRRTKQHIVQNTIWVILYEKIFCTPFRVLGNEGKSLEREWIEKYGQDRGSTPTPTKDSENWRYETMKKCTKAAGQTSIIWEPSYNVKSDYESSMKEATEGIAQELERVAPVDGSDKQRVVDLVRKAAMLWLEVGLQRCRVFLLMSDLGEEPSRSGQASLDRDGVQKLVVVPELRRMGNVHGERLERDELVSGCKGRFSVLR